MSDTTTRIPTQTNATPPVDSNAVLNAALQYLMGQRQQAAAPPAPVNRSIISLLGEALGGGASDVAPAEREAAGTRALLNFGANLSAASGPSVMPRNFGQILAQGVGGAEQSLGSSAAVSASRMAAQQAYEEKQQELTISRIKESIPLLQMLQTAARGKALLGGGDKPGTSIAAAGDVGAPVIARDTSMTAGQQANNPGNVMVMPGKGLPAGATGAVPVTGGYVAAFPDVPTGVAAHSDTLNGYAAAGVNTVRDAVTRWVGPGMAPKETMDSYIADVAKAAGVGPDDKINLADPKVQRAFIVAQQPHESGKAWLSPADVDKGLALAAARRAQAARPGGSGAVPAATAAPGAPASAPAATSAPAGPAGPPAVSPPTLATGGEAAGPGGLPTRNARMTTVSPAAQTDADTIIRGMTGAGADPTTLAPPGGPPVATVDTAGPGAPTDVQAQTRGLVVPPGVTPPPGVAPAAPQVRPPPAPEMPPQYVRQPLPPDIQRDIDHPETPAISEAYRNAIAGATTPEQQNAAIDARRTAIEKNVAEAKVRAEAWQTKQQELFNTNAQKLIDNKQALAVKQQELDATRQAAADKVQAEAAAASLANRAVQINKLRDTAITADDAQLKGFRTDANSAEGTVKLLDIMRSVEKGMPESGSTFYRDHPQMIDSWFSRLGLDSAGISQLDNRALFQKLLGGLAVQMSQKTAVGPGTARGVEVQSNLEGLPDQATDHMGRLKLMGFIQNMAQDQIRRANEADDYYYTHDHPSKDLDLHQSLYKFQQYYQDKYPSIIPRAPVGATNAEMRTWAEQNVKPGMVYEAPIYRKDPLTGIIRDRVGKPVVDHYELQPRVEDQ